LPTKPIRAVTRRPSPRRVDPQQIQWMIQQPMGQCRR
jgi:hypothetical protein